jgi:SAM-dependent methyltransferase
MIRYDSEYTFTFHSSGLEPWVLGLLRQFKPKSVLDVGCCLGFWGLVLRGYLGVSRVVGVDVDPVKVEFARRLNVYDGLYVSDIRSFDCSELFDVVLAVESIHGVLDAGLLRKLESCVRMGDLVVLTLPSMPRSITLYELTGRGYMVYRYLLRGFLLVKVDRAEALTMPSRMWRLFGLLVKLLHPLLRLLGMLGRGYLIALRWSDCGYLYQLRALQM